MKFLLITCFLFPVLLDAQVPEPPTVPRPKIYMGHVAEDLEDTIDIEVIDEFPPPPPPKPFQSKKQDENRIWESYEVDTEASYSGGWDSLVKDLSEVLIYPESAKEMAIEGRVYVEFVIDTSGAVSQIKILRGIHPDCDKAAVQAVKKLKPFIPAERRGRKVKQRFRLPVKFSIND